MSSASEDKEKLYLNEIKPLRPSFKIKFIEVHSKEVKLANSIMIEATWPFKIKFKIESEDYFNCIQNSKIVPVHNINTKFGLLLDFLSNLF